MKKTLSILLLSLVSNFLFSQEKSNLQLELIQDSSKKNINLDSLLINIAFGKEEEQFIEKIIATRHLKPECNPSLSKKLIDSICNGILLLGKEYASDFSRHSAFTNKLLGQSILALSLSKACPDVKYYQQSKLLLRLIYILRNYGVYYAQVSESKINNDIIDYNKDSGVIITKNNLPPTERPLIPYESFSSLPYESMSIDDFKYNIITQNDTIKNLIKNCDPISDEMIVCSQLFKFPDQKKDKVFFGPAIISTLNSFSIYMHDLDIKYEERRTSNQEKLTFLFILTTIISILAILFAIINIIRRKRLLKVVGLQKKEIELKNQEIISSIDYAKRIQTALLPNIEDIDKKLKEYFILYRPKDIVSGDFYYFNVISNDVFVASADCTGHGVPGAFMSLIGSKELHLANTKTTSPSEILAILNNGIKETLKQNNKDGTRDGMDIALVKINGSQVTYSGANRPLWILKNNSLEIEEIKATKSAIAGFTEDNYKFEEHKFHLNTKDTIYLFSDGFIDQFGGVKQKKLTIKRFREYLLSIKNNPMNEQKLLLNSFFEEWKGNIEQVDDVLVIGIRL